MRVTIIHPLQSRMLSGSEEQNRHSLPRYFASAFSPLSLLMRVRQFPRRSVSSLVPKHHFRCTRHGSTVA